MAPVRCEYHAIEEVQWLTGEGLLTPQQCVFRLTARPGAFDLNRKQAALQRLRYGCCHAGLSDKVREMLPFQWFRIILLWLKSPSPLSHILFSRLFQQPAGCRRMEPVGAALRRECIAHECAPTEILHIFGKLFSEPRERG